MRGLCAESELGLKRLGSVLGLSWITLHCAACGSSSAEPEPGSDAGVPAVILDGGGGIEDPPDGESLCGSGECNYQARSGCAADLACRPQLEGDEAVARCEAAGATPVGGACTRSTDCVAGALCAANLCRAVCCGGDWSACPDGQSCIRQLELGLPQGGSTPAGVDLCFPVGTCDVLDSTSCSAEPGRDCQLVDPRGSEACAPIGTVQAGGKCDARNNCSAGHSCVGGRCTRLCRALEVDAGDPRPCPDPDDTCVHFDRDPPGVGECTRVD